MFSVFVKHQNGTTQTFEQVSNISVTSGRILVVINNKMFSFRPGDLQEVRFSYSGRKKVIE